jgi:hypothetical protein
MAWIDREAVLRLIDEQFAGVQQDRTRPDSRWVRRSDEALDAVERCLRALQSQVEGLSGTAHGPHATQEQARLGRYLATRWAGHGTQNTVDLALAVMEEHRHCRDLEELGLVGHDPACRCLWQCEGKHKEQTGVYY